MLSDVDGRLLPSGYPKLILPGTLKRKVQLWGEESSLKSVKAQTFVFGPVGFGSCTCAACTKMAAELVVGFDSFPDFPLPQPPKL